MRNERALERLQDELALQRRRLRHGVVSLALAAATFVACRLLIHWALPFVLAFTVGVGALALGMIWSAEGGLKTLMTARQIRRLRQLPEARVIDR